MFQVCRICLKEIKNQSFISLDDDRKSLQIKRELSFCLPEITINIVSNSVLCEFCVANLHLMYVFQNKCLRNEKVLKNFIYSNKLDPGSVSLVEFVERTKGEDLHSSRNQLEVNERPKQPDRLNETFTASVDFIDDLNNALDQILVNDTTGFNIDFDFPNSIKKEDKDDNFLEDFSVRIDQLVKEEPLLNANEEGMFNLHNVFNDENMQVDCDQNDIPQDTAVKPCFVKLVPLQEQLFQDGTDNTNNVNTEIPTVNETRKRLMFPCEVCNREFKLQIQLQQHIKIHNEDRKPYVCMECNFTTPLQCTYQMHLEMHKFNAV